MEPRSLEIYGTQWVTVWYDPVTSGIMQSFGQTPVRYSQLDGIISDNVRQIRPTNPLGTVLARKNRMRVKYPLDPKRHQYVLRRDSYPIGTFQQSFGSAEFNRYDYINGALQRPFPVVDEVNSGLYTAADKRVKTGFFKKLKKTDLDLSISAAEYSKTRLMVINRAQLLMKVKMFFKQFWRRVRGRSIQRHESIAKSTSGAWLEYVYGWRQLAGDIFAIASFATSCSMSSIVKFRCETQDHKSYLHRDAYSGIEVNVTEKQSIFSEMKVKLTRTANPFVDLSRIASLNPIAIAWELLPFSFVFDWLFNISQFLSELQGSATFSAAFAGGYVTHTYKTEMVSKAPAQRAIGTGLRVTIPQEIVGSRVYVKKNRVLLTDLPLPALPVLKCPVSAEHALTTISLISQRLSNSALGRRARWQ